MNSKMIAKKIAEESIVLLENKEQLLPLSGGTKVAFFGRAQVDTIYSGNGSGAARSSGCTNILEECEKKGLYAEPFLKIYYSEQIVEENRTKEDEFDWSNLGQKVTCGFMYEIFGRYHAPMEEYAISEDIFAKACAYTDTAIFVLGRNSGGEECDRHLEEDYFLTKSEANLLSQVCGAFENVILILNINGLVDLSWAGQYKSIKSILFVGIPGEEGASALAEILTGKVNPSGKLAFTIAKKYEDYPSASHFSWNKDDAESILTYENYGLSAEKNGSIGYEKSPVTVYMEDIFNGYRYFDTYEKEPLYAFGYGLSYTTFELFQPVASKSADGIEVKVNVKNTGSFVGKEVVQIYLEDCNNKRQCAVQQLKGFEKTKNLEPEGEEQICCLIPWKEFATYEETSAAYMIKQGNYRILVGNSSRNTMSAADIQVPEDIITERCINRLFIRSCNKEKLSLLKCPERTRVYEPCLKNIIISQKDIPADRNPNRENREILQKVLELSAEQLAALCVGYGPGTPFSAFGDGSDPETIYDSAGKPLTTNSHSSGTNGYISPAIEEKEIYSIFYKDGPAGIGETVWPSEMLTSCAFNREVWYEFGNAVGAECEKQKVDVWLAPAVNLHRHPLCGRNFEYFSEDPYLTGKCACEITRGVQENHPVLVCPKHFAVNEQETFRRGSANRNYDAVDSIISERAARELYLKPFEMLVKEADIGCIMTSFNKINGVFSGGNQDLCTHILREEWGYKGVVVTDWGDMDIVVDGAEAVAAGNDIVMPGGPPVIAQILKGYQAGRLSRESMEIAVTRLLHMRERIDSRNNR